MQPNVELAQDALGQWQEAKYKECVASLRQIENNLSTEGAEGDGAAIAKAKVLHNIAVAEFASSDGPRTAILKLANGIADVVREIEENSNVGATEDEEGGEGEGKNDNVDSKEENGNGINDSSSSSNSAVLPNNKNARFQPDASFALYNQAVVHVYLRKWRSALTVLEDLFRYVDALDESLALCICFLLLEVYTLVARGAGYGDGGLLLDQVVDRAQRVVDYLEKPHFFNGHKDWSGGQESEAMSAVTAAMSSVKLGDDGGQAKEGGEKCFTARQIRLIHSRLACYKYKLVLAQASVSTAKADAKSSANKIWTSQKSASVDQKQEEGLGPVPWQGISLVPSKLKDEEGYENAFACLRANMEFLTGGFAESARLLSEALKHGVAQGIFWNNMGCVHHMLAKHSLAAVYFSRALDFYRSHSNPRPEVAYNLGVQLLRLGKPLRAYDCFTAAAKCNYHRPRLWLHVAECVVMAHGNSTAASTSTNGLLDCVSGENELRRILLKPTSRDEQPSSAAAKPSRNKSEKSHKRQQQEEQSKSLELQIGLQATAYVLFLLDNAESLGSTSNAGASGKHGGDKKEKAASNKAALSAAAAAAKNPNAAEGVAALESDSDLCRQQTKRMRLTALLCRAYLALWTKDWSLVHSASEKAIRLANLSVSEVASASSSAAAAGGSAAVGSGTAGESPADMSFSSVADAELDEDARHTLSIAHSYCAEALLNLPGDALDKPKALDHIAKAMEFDSENSASPSTSALLCVNTALLRLVNEETDEAARLLNRAAELIPDSPHAIRLLTFLYAYQGDQDRARRLLKTSQ